MIVAACFYADQSAYPNITVSTWEERNALYWRCLATMAFSVRAFGKHSDRIIVFSNQLPPDCFKSDFERSNVEIIEIPFGYKPPADFYSSFIGALYLLDGISWAADNLAEDESILFLDPDCLVVSDLSPIDDQIQKTGLVAYDQSFPLNHESNGLSRLKIWELESACFGKKNEKNAPAWLGGEILGLRQNTAKHLAKRLQGSWHENLLRFNSGAEKYNTEEQLISASVHVDRLEYFNAADGYIKRIWTASVYRRYDQHDKHLLIWHLPSEKGHGLKLLYQKIQNDRGTISAMPLNERLEFLSAILGLRNSFLREGRYIFTTTINRIFGLMSGKINRYD